MYKKRVFECFAFIGLLSAVAEPTTLKELHRRLSGRATEDEAALNLRLDNAREEIKHWRDYQYVITSRTPSEDRAAFQAVLDAERLRTSRLHLPSDSKSRR